MDYIGPRLGWGKRYPPVVWHSLCVAGWTRVVAGTGIPDNPRSWDDIPGVAIVGVALGLVLIVAAIRYMAGKK